MLKDIIDLLADPVDGTDLHGADEFTRLVSGIVTTLPVRAMSP